MCMNCDQSVFIYQVKIESMVNGLYSFVFQTNLVSSCQSSIDIIQSIEQEIKDKTGLSAVAGDSQVRGKI